VLIYTLLIIPEMWRQLVKYKEAICLVLNRNKDPFTNWRHASGIIYKVYNTFTIYIYNVTLKQLCPSPSPLKDCFANIKTEWHHLQDCAINVVSSISYDTYILHLHSDCLWFKRVWSDNRDIKKKPLQNNAPVSLSRTRVMISSTLYSVGT